MLEEIVEFAWRTTQQLQFYEAEETDLSKIKGWGSGFFLTYRGRLFFITADHCIHSGDYAEGRLGKDDMVCVVNNIVDRDNWNSLMTPVGGFFYFDRYDVNRPDMAYLQDYAISYEEGVYE